MRRAQSGLTATELLVALAIGLTLIAGFGSMVVGSRQSGRAERNLQELRITGSAGLDVMAQSLRKAGFRLDRDRELADLFPVAAAPFDQAGAVVVSIPNAVGLAVRYQGAGDTWTTDCLGNAVASRDVVWESLWLREGALWCRVRNQTLGTDTSEMLIPQVEALELTYGVDTSGDGLPDVYLASTAVTDWTRVASVKVQIRVVSAEDGLADAPHKYLGADGTLTTASDRRLRRSLTTVAALRNVLP